MRFPGIRAVVEPGNEDNDVPISVGQELAGIGCSSFSRVILRRHHSHPALSHRGEGLPWQRASDLPRKTVAVIERHHTRDPGLSAAKQGGHVVTAQSDWNFLTSVAENYERNLVPIIFAPWADELVETAWPRQEDRVLDVACVDRLRSGRCTECSSRREGG